MIPPGIYSKWLHPYSQIKRLILVLALISFHTTMYAQIGPLIWEDNFNTLDNNIWLPDIGDGCDIGLCGWGNAELQSYQADNVYIADVPGEPENKALVLEARNQQAGSRAFTSGKVTTQGNLSVHYGLIEVRVRVPDLNMGLWPAVWLLGANNLTWPAKGEIDMMEMGFSQAGRDFQQEPNSTVNNYVGANAFFATEGGGVGNIAFDVDYNQPYVAATPLNDRFVTYRIYWEPTQVRFTVVDDSIERDLYTNPLPIDPDGVTGVFSRPFYMLLNLAVGGTLPGVLVNNEVTAPLPGKMYVDYVRVYQWNGHGSVALNYDELTAEAGTFGVYTDQTPTNNELTFGADAQIYAWGGTLEDGTIPPYEGSNVISWKTTAANSWFGGGIVSLSGKDMSGFVEEGSLKFRIKIPGNVSFRIGLTDNFTNEKYIEFPAGQTKYGLVRNGEWGLVEIPLVDFSGLLAFQDIGYMFAITSLDGALPSSIFEFAIDDIIWDDGKSTGPAIVSSITVSPASATIGEGQTAQLQASAFDQYGAPISTSFNWSTTGGNVSNTGLYTATLPGSFTVTASSNSVSGSASITVNAATSGFTIPGVVEAEDYEDYFDTTTGNTGGAYRSDDVDIEITGDATGSYNVGWIARNEWLRYTLNATAGSGNYDVIFRVASSNGNGRFRMEIDGNNITGTLASPNTGGWQNYVDVIVEDITIGQGQHDLRIFFENAGLNINYISFTEATGPSTPNACSQLAANGDYTVVFSSDSNNPTVTFVPSASGIGTPTCILYYSTNPGATFPGYPVSPDTPFTINAQNGETVYLYYTYSVPEGGERNTSANRHSFVVGSCNTNTTARTASDRSSDNDITNQMTWVSVYPNPIGSELTIDMPATEHFEKLAIIDMQGRVVIERAIIGQRTIKINTRQLPEGMYMVELSGAAQRIVRKIVK